MDCRYGRQRSDSGKAIHNVGHVYPKEFTYFISGVLNASVTFEIWIEVRYPGNNSNITPGRPNIFPRNVPGPKTDSLRHLSKLISFCNASGEILSRFCRIYISSDYAALTLLEQ